MHTFFHLQVGIQELKAAPASALVFGIYLIHIVAFALLSYRLFKVQLEPLAGCAAYLTTGYAVFGFYIWAAGYLSLLNASFFVISTVFWGIAAIVFFKRDLRINGHLQSARSAINAHWGLALIVALTFVFAAISGTRGAALDDSYHWQSAEFWAVAGRWVKVPYRLTNGTAMSEMLHVPAAVFDNLTAAHWASTGIWICCALSAAALASRLGVSTIVALIAVLSIPIFTASASTLNSDIPGAAFALAAFVFLLGHGEPVKPPRAVLLAGLMFAAVLSCKFILLAGLPAAVAICLWQSGIPISSRLCNAGILIAPVILTGLLWMAHTYHLIGQPFDPSGKHMARTPDDPMWLTGAAAGRIPRPVDLLRLPLEPFLTTIWGQEEPFGGRTGLLWLALLPVTLFLVLKNRIASQTPLVYFLVAISFYLLLAPIVLKTRFLLFFFLCMALLSAAAYEHRRFLPRWAGMAVTALFLFTAVPGILDGNRKLAMNVIIDTPPPRHAPRVI